MQEEMERKFLIDKDSAERLIKASKNSIGIAQWYDENGRRLRLEIFKEKTGFRHEWTETFKTNTADRVVRLERERTIDPKTVNLEELKNMKGVFKVRHILKKDPEVVLDEFVEIDGRMVKDEKGEPLNFLMEIEKKTKNVDFNEELKSLGINAKDVTENEEFSYDNFNLAYKHGISPYRIIEFLQYRVIGPVKILAMQGRSLSNNLKKNKKYDLDILGNTQKTKEELLEELENFDDKELYELSAELGSLFLMKKKGFQIDEVTYITFPDNPEYMDEDGTPKIYFFLKGLTESHFNCKVNQYFLDYNSKDEKSILSSVRKLWKFLESNFKDEKREIIMDVAGGQKYPSIAAALYFLLNNRAFYYKQDKGILTKFPPIPIIWNFNVLDENLSAFKLVGNHERNFSYEDYLSLPGLFKDLFELSESFGISTPLPLNDIFEKYMQARKMPFGYGERFIELIENEDMREFMISKITKKWNLMWIGDQIPETVEHSQRHSKRLMEFTVNLINIIGEETFLVGVPQDLKDEFYFTLGVAMNVHDLGHTALSYILDGGKELSLSGLPSIVRDLHNELSYQMMANSKAKETYKLLDGIERFKNGRNLEKAIALVSRYHRNHMPIDEKFDKRKKRYMEIFSVDIEPLKNVVEREFKGSKDWQDLTIAATRWLKFIDGSDVQSDRTVMKEYNDVRIWRTQSEVLNLCKDLLGNGEIWKDKTFSNVRQDVVKISDLAEDADKNSKILEEIAKKIEEKVYEEVEKSITKTDYGSQITVNEYVRKLDKLAFKARQFPHFKKHRLVQAIYPRFYKRKDFENQAGILYMRLIKEEEHGKENKVNEEIIESVKADVKKEFQDSGLSKYAIKSVIFD